HSSAPSGSTHQWPTDTDVANAIAGHAVIMNLANNPACPNGPLPNGGIPQGSPSKPASNTGWIFITDPSTAGNGSPNGPRGGLGSYPPPNLGAGCNNVTPATGNEPIKVTLWYTFQPITNHPASHRQQHRHHCICGLPSRVLQLDLASATCKRAR